MQPIGQAISRLDGRDKVLGRTRYTADHTGPALTHAVLVQSEIPHGTLSLSLIQQAIAEAEAQPGVLYILTPANCPQLHTLPAEITDDLPCERRPPLADAHIEYVGQHLALVVAETLEQATYAASLIHLPAESLPSILTPHRALPIPAHEHGQIRAGTYLPDHFTKLKSEQLQYTRGARTLPNRLAETYTTPVHTHNPMELSATIASWHGDQLTLRDTTRWIMGSRKVIAHYLAIPEESIHVLAPFLGGAFGSKGFLWMHVVLAAVAAHRLARPVKLVLTRRQMFTSTGHRPQTVQQLALAATPQGRLTSTEHHTLTATSTVAQFTEPTGLTTRHLYQCTHVQTTHRVARLNHPTPCFMRAPGESSGAFALESAMDELAYALNMDPLALRLQNYAPVHQPNDRPWSSNHLRECFEAASTRFNWQARTPAPRSMQRAGRLVGQGMATATYPARQMPAGCRATLTPGGCARFFSATHELGNGVRTVMAQIAAEHSGLPLTHVRFFSGDSHSPNAPYTGASQTSATVGSAVREAALLLQARILAAAAQHPAFSGLPPQALTLAAGCITHGTTEIPYAQVLTEPITVEATSSPTDPELYGFQSFGAHFCEVEVDESIGQTRVTRWSCAFDGGTVLNPKLARSQIMGGIVFGIGQAFLEATLYDPHTALPVNATLAEYHLPTCADVPDFDITLLNHPDLRFNPLGARGIGELGIVGAAAALANAIFHATGKRLRQLPITCDQLLA